MPIRNIAAAQALRSCSLELVCSLFYCFLCPGRYSHSGFGLGGLFGGGLLRNGNLFGFLGFLSRVERGLRPFDETTPDNMLLRQQFNHKCSRINHAVGDAIGNFMDAGADGPLGGFRSFLYLFSRVDTRFFESFRS